jgi:hypothetical protein
LRARGPGGGGRRCAKETEKFPPSHLPFAFIPSIPVDAR